MIAKGEEVEKKVNEMLDTKKTGKYTPEATYTSHRTHGSTPQPRYERLDTKLTPPFLLTKRIYMIYAIGLGGS